MSSTPRRIADFAERFLADAGFDRAPWLAVVFAGGILTWFALASPWQWMGAMGCGVLIALGALAAWRGDDDRGHLRSALVASSLVFAAGIAVIWLRSETVGAEPINRPVVERVQGYVLEREDQPSRDRIRLTLAVRDAETGTARKIRVNVPSDTPGLAGEDGDGLTEGAVVRARVRLMPPASPMLPGAYDFARAAWFKGLAATGSVVGGIDIIEAAPPATGIAAIQRGLSAHVRERVSGSAGTIAAAFASGDRGAIAEADEDAMRDAGLTHLLSISGLHVSAVIAAAYLLALKLLALVPPIALRIRLPVAAAAVGALAGIGYTLLTGAEVPTVRSCAAAMLVLIALAMGRDALSLRMVATAAAFVMLLWPESVVGPSFQMSFSAVLAIVALHSSSPAKAFLAPREEPWVKQMGRRVTMLFVTGLVIEIALMPIVLFHFHRAGLYGAFANVIAIPLVTFVSMPLIALALFLDTVDAGAPAWWLVQHSLDALLGLAHMTASQPGAVKLMPQMDRLTIGLFVIGALWLALWNGSARLWGLVPAAVASVMLIGTPIPDILVGREGRHVGITIEGPRGERQLLSLRDSRSSYSRDNLLELASVTSDPIALPDWPGAECSDQFCVITIARGGRDWSLLMARNRDLVEERALAAACERSDIVIADRFLPRSCKPRWLKADRRLLVQTGGLAIDLKNERIATVAEGQGEHGWWRGEQP
ncbi:ComEC/Rec2 family competence protein [Erythrobacter rubeus]|uniref:ComEC/Rec2 family competence protein n=1 Tax=Erythrobacter rubeus TaxID=2760803 RepID=UPI002E29711A|nr:ComEC/Rec2 family competence protein [Erythrobacter rubeus]